MKYFRITVFFILFLSSITVFAFSSSQAKPSSKVVTEKQSLSQENHKKKE